MTYFGSSRKIYKAAELGFIAIDEPFTLDIDFAKSIVEMRCQLSFKAWSSVEF